MQALCIYLFVLTSLVVLSNAEFTTLQWADCGSPQVQFFDMAVKPMPILQPGPINLKEETAGK